MESGPFGKMADSRTGAGIYKRNLKYPAIEGSKKAIEEYQVYAHMTQEYTREALANQELEIWD